MTHTTFSARAAEARLPKKTPRKRPTSDTPHIRKNRGQSRKHSLLESITNVVVGYALAVFTQTLIFPLFGVYLHFSENLAIAGVFTAISVVRSYALRRVFNALNLRGVA